MKSELNKQIVNLINKAWAWKGVVAYQIIDTNQFGNIIFRSDKNEFYRICPEELSLNKIANSMEEYNLLKSQTEFKIDWEMKNLVQTARIEIGELKEKEKYCLKIPAVLGSNYEKENIAKISFDELISISGDLALQICDLNDGQKIELKIVTKNKTV